MADQAHITSVEAVEAFRADFVVFLSKAGPAVDEIRSEISHARTWVETEQRMHWQTQLRKRAQKLQEAEAELFRIRLSPLQDVTERAQMEVRRARAALHEAQAKLKMVKIWTNEFDRRVGPLTKPSDRLRDFLANEMTSAAQELTQIVKLLADYANLHQGYSSIAGPPLRTDDDTSNPGGGT